jgi:hypothetical protein
MVLNLVDDFQKVRYGHILPFRLGMTVAAAMTARQSAPKRTFPKELLQFVFLYCLFAFQALYFQSQPLA